ncbi:preprotein translocase subunit YajC [Chromobacterium phragmitis]|uniref:Sec translocon accessory complex subunit YajC n=1 Tax=Chromobacterium phragmitis TaxID=2202141 RepID=A0A344UM46_9NEIS|nr:preprotein translocase subunit YajC [Chromobacterium phragmitis]AXE30950.1 preprotein translocase subunit YajC [Chromobacterium phragmitis]AXE36344.1 preprotein translocase subunit YajC [Chromobacterium phragmitis]
MFITPAFASGSAAPAGFDLMGFLPMIVIFVLFWFLMVRPQQKRMKETQKMLSELQKGDEVVTQGGIVGRVSKVSEQFLTLEIADNVEIHVQRAAVSAKLEKGTLKSL